MDFYNPSVIGIYFIFVMNVASTDVIAEGGDYDFTSANLVQCEYYHDASVILIADFIWDGFFWQLSWPVEQKLQNDNVISPLEATEAISRISKYFKEIGMPEDFLISKDNFVGVTLCNDGKAGGIWLYQFTVSFGGFLTNPGTRPINVPILIDGTIPRFSLTRERKIAR